MTPDIFDEKKREKKKYEADMTRAYQTGDTYPTKTYSSALVINNICIYGVLMSERIAPENQKTDVLSRTLENQFA